MILLSPPKHVLQSCAPSQCHFNTLRKKFCRGGFKNLMFTWEFCVCSITYSNCFQCHVCSSPDSSPKAELPIKVLGVTHKWSHRRRHLWRRLWKSQQNCRRCCKLFLHIQIPIPRPPDNRKLFPGRWKQRGLFLSSLFDAWNAWVIGLRRTKLMSPINI